MDTRLKRPAQQPAESTSGENQAGDSPAIQENLLQVFEPARQFNDSAALKIDVRNVNFFYDTKQALDQTRRNDARWLFHARMRGVPGLLRHRPGFADKRRVCGECDAGDGRRSPGRAEQGIEGEEGRAGAGGTEDRDSPLACRAGCQSRRRAGAPFTKRYVPYVHGATPLARCGPSR